MNNQEKAKHYAERITEINRQVETGTVNFEQARVTIIREALGLGRSLSLHSVLGRRSRTP